MSLEIRKIIIASFVFFLNLCISYAHANSAPVVSHVTVSQRTDGSKLVDIRYNLSDADGDKCTVSVQVSNDGGSTWTVPAISLSGAIGANVSPGTGKLIIWDCGADLPGVFGSNYRIKVTADDGMVDIIPITWVSINDPGIGGGHEGFNGQMSKYETTNDQYCQFLNAAKASNQITVYTDNVVYATSDISHSQPYFNTYASSSYSQITYSGGTFSVRSRDGYSMANHPVVMVSWYGATAFCNYYGYRLPTEWEWQAVADYDGNYTYGCGTTISKSKANYYDNGYANPLGLTSEPYTSQVGYYPVYGYGMCDMAGNVWEWTSSCLYSDCSPDDFRVVRGGSWHNGGYYCTISYTGWINPGGESSFIGFRVCR
jgi:hypothetical protein